MTVTDTTANAILDLLLGAGANTVAPATYLVGMNTSASVPASDGTGVTEPSGGSYARVSLGNNSTNFATAATGRTKSNSTTITFPQATANWGTITHWLLFDAAGTNLLNYGVWAASQVVNSGNSPSIAAGGLVVEIQEDI